MRFTTKLDIAIRRGRIAVIQGGLFVPSNQDMRCVLPLCRSPVYSTFKRAMWRNGYVMRGELWYLKECTPTLGLNRPVQRPRCSRSVGCRQLQLRAPPATERTAASGTLVRSEVASC